MGKGHVVVVGRGPPPRWTQPAKVGPFLYGEKVAHERERVCVCVCFKVILKASFDPINDLKLNHPLSAWISQKPGMNACLLVFLKLWQLH